MKLKKTLSLACASFMVLAGAAHAQEPAQAVVAEGLNAPRHISVDAGGVVYIVEAGNGGETPSLTIIGEVTIGNSGRVWRILPDGDGTPELFLDGLFSVQSPRGEATGAHKVELLESGRYLIIGQGPMKADMPEGDVAFALMRIEDDNSLSLIADIYAAEETLNPDGAGLDSNPVDFLEGPDGAFYVADAGANAVWRVTPEGEVSVFAAWAASPDQPQSVPTAVASDGESLYVSFLTGFPFLPGASSIEAYSFADGTLQNSIPGLTMVTDLEIVGGEIYALQWAASFGMETGFQADSGSIVRVNDQGILPVVSGLNYPYGMARLEDGSFLVSINTAFSAPSAGAVIRVQEGDAFAPAATETP